jgi:TP901 family phage tail tape measure protein
MAENELGLGVKFTATIGDFAAQLAKIEEQLKSFAKNLEAMGTTAEKAGKTLTSANKDAEKAITQVTAATKEAVVATGDAAKAAETLASGMEKAKESVSKAGSSASKTALDLKGLSFEQSNMLTGVGKLVSDPVMGSLIDKLKKAGTESIGYQKGLIGAAKEADNSEIAFKTLSAALMTNEKYLSTVADGTKKVRSELGANALPRDMQSVVEGVDRLKFAQATLAGEMYKTGGVVLDGRGKFVELQKTIAGLTETQGQAAMSFTNAASRLGSYGTTVKSITSELKAYNAMHSEAVGINEKMTEQVTKLKSVYGGPDGLATSTGKYRAEFDKLVGSLDGSKNQMTVVENNAKRLNAAFVESEKGTTAWNEAVKNTGVITPRTATVMQGLQNAVSGGIMTQKEATKALISHNAELVKLSEVAARPRGILAGLSQSLLGGASAANKAEGYFARLGTAIGSLAAWIPAAMIISGLTEAIMSSITAVKDYDQSLKSLQAISGGTDAEIDLLGKTMLQLSADTKYSAAEIAKGAIYIAQAGFTAGESMDVIAAAAKGAQGTLEPLTTAADLLTTVLRAFHIDASEASVVMDKLAMAANKSKTDLEGMKTVFNYLGPAAYSAGLNLNEVLGSLMALSNVGMRMSTVGTSLRQVFIGLENPSAKLKAALAALGMTVDDLSVKKMGGLIPVLQNLDKVIGGSLTNAVQFFNVRAGNAALVISQMNEHVAMMIQFTKEYGASAAMAGTQTEGMSVKISMLSNQFRNFIIGMAEGGLTNAFKAILDAVSKLIKVIEYLVNNSFTNFIITTGIMYASLIGLRSVILMVGNALSVILVGASLQASITAVNTMGVMVALKDVFSNLILVIGNVGKAVYSAIVFFLTMGTSTTALTAATGFLREAWIALNAVFAKSPIGLLVTGLALLAAAIYTVVNSSEKQSKALQENAITYANNEQAATRFATKLRELDVEQKTGVDNSDSYVAVLKQIRETFPEVTSELVKNKGSLEAQAIALDKVAANYAKLNEVAAKTALADLTRQYNAISVEVGVYSRTLSENRSLLEQTAIAITSMIPGIGNLVVSMFGVQKATDEANRAWTNIKLAWNNMSDAQLANDAATKLSEAMNKQRELFPQVASIIVNSSRRTRQALIDMVPEGEMKRAALGAVAIHDAMVSSLIVKTGVLKEKEINAVADMGAKWVEYYKQQDAMGQAEVAQFAGNADRKIATALKAFEKENKDSKDYNTLRINEEIRLNEEFFQKMLDARAKNVENLLKLEDTLYEGQHARRKAALEVTLGLMDLEQKQMIVNLGNQGLKEAEYLKQKESIEKLYFERNKLAIEANTAVELASLDAVYQAKKKTLEMDTTLTEEAKKAKMAVIESENAVKLIAIYKEQLAAYKTHISEKVTEFNRYKAEYDKSLQEIQRLEDAHLKVLAAADKRFLDDKLAAEKSYRRQIADILLSEEKQFEDIEKLKRDAKQSTMTASEKLADKEREINETLAKGYKALAEAEKASDSETKKAKTKAAEDYFKDATGMVKSLEKTTIGSDGAIIVDKQATKDKQLGFYGEIEAAFKAAYASERQAADTAKNEVIAAAKKEKEDVVSASAEKKDKLVADLMAIAKVSKDNMEAVGLQVKNMMDMYSKIVEQVGKAIEIKADVTKAMEEIKKLTDHIEVGRTKGAYKVVLEFLGKASPEGPLADIITKIKGWLTELQGLIEKGAKFVIAFSGFDVIDSLITKMNALFTASNRTATFTVRYVTEGQPSSTGPIQTSTDNNYNGGSGSNGSPYYAEGGIIPGTGEGDTVPAMLTPGEFVVRKSAVNAYGKGFFQAINNMKNFFATKFAFGGMVHKILPSMFVGNWSGFSTTGSGGGSMIDATMHTGIFSNISVVNDPKGPPMSDFYKKWKEAYDALKPEDYLVPFRGGFIDLRRMAVRGVIPITINGWGGPVFSHQSRDQDVLHGGYYGYAEGGSIPGAGNTDSVPAMLTPGEFVVRKSAVSAFGEGFFNMVNNMKSFVVPKFNLGGAVPAFANGGSVRNNEVITLNLQVGTAALPLTVVGNPTTMRQNIRAFEKELSRMRLSHA